MQQEDNELLKFNNTSILKKFNNFSLTLYVTNRTDTKISSIDLTQPDKILEKLQLIYEFIIINKVKIILINNTNLG